MSAADASTLPLISPLSVNGGRDPNPTSIGALDTQSQAQEELQIGNPPTPPKILNNGASTFSQDIESQYKESAMVDEGREALKRYQAMLNCFLIAAYLLFFVSALSLVGGIVFTQTEWAEFIDPILDLILPEPLPVAIYPKPPPLPWVLQIYAPIAKGIPLYFTVAAMRLVYAKKRFLENCERGRELEYLARAEQSAKTKLIWTYILYALGCFSSNLICLTDSSRHKAVIQRTFWSLVTLMLLHCLWDMLLMLSNIYSIFSNQPAQSTTTSNDMYNTSEASSQGTGRHATAQ